MLSTHLLCLLLLFCFAQSKAAESELDSSSKGFPGKYLKEGRGNGKCLCGSQHLPDYRGSKDFRYFQKMHGNDDGLYEKAKMRKGLKKCSCSKVSDEQHVSWSKDDVKTGQNDGTMDDLTQIDRYLDFTESPLKYNNMGEDDLKKNVEQYRNNYGKRVEMKRFVRSSEQDKSEGIKMKLEQSNVDSSGDETGAIVKQIQDDVVFHNRNASAQALETIGIGLGIASDVVQRVGERVGSTIGGRMAQTVLEQVSFGLGLASGAANTIAETKRNQRKKRFFDRDYEENARPSNEDKNNLNEVKLSLRRKRDVDQNEVARNFVRTVREAANISLRKKRHAQQDGNDEFINEIGEPKVLRIQPSLVQGVNKGNDNEIIRQKAQIEKRNTHVDDYNGIEPNFKGYPTSPRRLSENIIQVRNASKNVEEIATVIITAVGESFRKCIIDVIINGQYRSSNYRYKNATVIREKFKQIAIILGGVLNTSSGLVESIGPVFIGPIISRVVACCLQTAAEAVSSVYGTIK